MGRCPLREILDPPLDPVSCIRFNVYPKDIFVPLIEGILYWHQNIFIELVDIEKVLSHAKHMHLILVCHPVRCDGSMT